MKNARILSAVLAVMLMISMLTACGGNETQVEMPEVNVDPSITVELNGETIALADLVANAQAERDIQSVGMPDDWANWKDSWNGINTTYGLTHGDVDMTSAEEIAIFLAEKDDPTKDVGDIGLSMTPEAIESTENLPVWGVQFHPESMVAEVNEYALNLFKAFIDRAKSKRCRK